MNKKILAAAALAIVSGSAMAANAELYGILDASISAISNTGSTTALSKTAMQDGVWLPSLWGMKGSEDLGEGMSAFFDLQSNLTVTNGQSDFGSTKLFDRSSIVGIGGDFGKISAGERLDPIWLQSIAEQAMGVHHSGSAAVRSLAYQSPGDNAYGVNTVNNVMSSNWLYYEAPKLIDNVALSAGYQFGNVAGTQASSSGYYLGGSYTKNGLTINLGNEAQNNSTNTVRLNRVLLGAQYSIGDFTVEGQQMRVTTTGATTTTYNPQTSANPTGKIDAQIGQFGVAYNISSKLKVGAQYVYISDNANNARPTNTSVNAVYSLSKRTGVYAHVENSNSANGIGLSVGYTNGGSSNGSANPSMVGVGVYHIF